MSADLQRKRLEDAAHPRDTYGVLLASFSIKFPGTVVNIADTGLTLNRVDQPVLPGSDRWIITTYKNGQFRLLSLATQKYMACTQRPVNGYRVTADGDNISDNSLWQYVDNGSWGYLTNVAVSNDQHSPCYLTYFAVSGQLGIQYGDLVVTYHHPETGEWEFAWQLLKTS
jgi:hypothetical protein